MGEERLIKFKDCLLALTRLLTDVEDGFFFQKLDKRISELTAVFLKAEGGEEPSVAQYSKFKLLAELDLILELTENMAYLKAASPTLLASSMAGLLALKLLLLKQKEIKPECRAEEKGQIKNPIKVSAKPSADSNREKILNFIRQTPNVRAKDVIDEFSILSERTVKRNLKDLTEQGLLQKKTEDRAVYYSVSSYN